jgi:hypothetical protein
MTDITPAALRPRTIPLEEVAELLGLSVQAVKRCIAADEEESMAGSEKGHMKLAYPARPDSIRRIPGGRRDGASYFVLRQPFDYHTAISSSEPITPIRKRKTG